MKQGGFTSICIAVLLCSAAVSHLRAGRPLREGEQAPSPAPEVKPPEFRKGVPGMLPLTGVSADRLSSLLPPTPENLAGGAENRESADLALFDTSVPPPLAGGEPSVGELQSLMASAVVPQLAPPPVMAVSPTPAPPRAPEPPAKPTAPPSPEQIRLLAVARRVAPAVVFLRAWDGHGNELANGCGFFLNDRGTILTDIQLVHPEFADDIEYISVGTGRGAHYRITGFWHQDPKSGLTILQSDATDTPHLECQPGGDFSREQPVSIVAFQPDRGLSLADATVKADATKVGDGWLNLRGEDSPGEPGSPVIDTDGRIIAVVSMRVPQGKWFNFGLRVDPVLEIMAKIPIVSVPNPLSRLARGTPARVTQDERFTDAFRSLYNGQIARGTSQLLLLLRTYPRSAEIWALLGLAYARLGASEESLSCSRKAVALDPRVGQFWQQLALSHLHGSPGKPNPAALEALERTVEEQPADKLAWLLLAEQQLLAAKYPAAEKSLIEVVKLEPDYAPASYLLAYSKARQGDLRSAESSLLRCLALDSRHLRARFYLALVYAKQGRFADAAAAYQRIVELQPSHPSAWRNLALMERKLGHDTAAQRAIEHHLRLGSGKR